MQLLPQAFPALQTLQHAKAWAVPQRGAAPGENPSMAIAIISDFIFYHRGFGGAFGLNVCGGEYGLYS